MTRIALTSVLRVTLEFMLAPRSKKRAGPEALLPKLKSTNG